MRKLIVIIIIIGLIGFWLYRENTTVGTSHYEISSDKLPESFDGYRIVQLSDLHDAKYGEKHLDVANKVKKLTPQLIFITGDLIDSNRYDLANSLALIEELRIIAPIFYVTGNHEIASNDTDRIKSSLEELGVRVLSNESEIVSRPNGESIAIGGIEDPLISELSDEVAIEMFVEQAFNKISDDTFKILLSHRPEQFEIYSTYGVDITFSGHAHGGQFRIPGLGGLISPGQGWFPKLTSGVHEDNGSRIVVSRGLGNSILPVRIFNQPEIVVVTLRNAE